MSNQVKITKTTVLGLEMFFLYVNGMIVAKTYSLAGAISAAKALVK